MGHHRKKKEPEEDSKFIRDQGREKAALEAAAQVREKLTIGEETKLALVLGTGWGSALELQEESSLSVTELSGFQGLGKLEGHNRRLRWGKVAGGVPVFVLQGRVHANERLFSIELMRMVRLQIEMLIQLGVTHFVITNAAGGHSSKLGYFMHMMLGKLSLAAVCEFVRKTRCKIKVGDLVLSDGFLTVGASERPPMYAGEFYAGRDVIAFEHFDTAIACGEQAGFQVHVGGYAFYTGPGFEDRKYDKPFFKLMGTSCVGMSTVPETYICALYQDKKVRVLPVSHITNDEYEKHSHDENLVRSEGNSEKLGLFLNNLVRSMSRVS